MRCAVMAIGLVLFSGNANAEWRVSSFVDRMSDKTIKFASVAAKAIDHGISADLEMSCLTGDPVYAVAISIPLMRGKVGGALRIDDGETQLRLFDVFSDSNRVHLLQYPPLDLEAKRRVRVQLQPAGAPILFYEFDVTGAAVALRAIGCKK